MLPSPLVPSHERVSAHKKVSVEKLPSPCKRRIASGVPTRRIDGPMRGSTVSQGSNDNLTVVVRARPVNFKREEVSVRAVGPVLKEITPKRSTSPSLSKIWP